MSKNENKRRKIDFVISDNEYSKIIFRFYPRRSHCHSFNDKPPKEWSDVYKVYYSYAIIRQYKDGSKRDVLFWCPCDECSVIDEVAFRIKLLGIGKTYYENTLSDENTAKIPLLDDEIFPYGYGVTWILRQRSNGSYEVNLFNFEDVGYRFFLPKDQLIKFGEFLNNCSEYMLAHGEPI